MCDKVNVDMILLEKLVLHLIQNT